jgi:predicted Zn-dependent protease
MKSTKNKLKIFPCIILIALTFFATSCKTVGLVAAVGGIVGELAGIEGSAEMAMSIVDSAESIDKALEGISPEQEYYIGRAVAAQLLDKYELYEAPAIENYLNQICGTLVLHSERPTLYKGYYVGILDTEEINAFATSGGHILVSRGLLNCAESEDALAAVLAHEIAHIQLEHSLTAIQNNRITNAITKTGFAAATVLTDGEFAEFTDVFGDTVEEIISGMVDTGYSKIQEFDADKNALAIMAAAGYNPYAMNDMLSLLKEKSNVKTGFGKTHPSPEDRMNNLKREYRKYDVEDTSASRITRFNQVMQSL